MDQVFEVGDIVRWSSAANEIAIDAIQYIEPFRVDEVRTVHGSVTDGRHPQLLELSDASGRHMLGPFSGRFLTRDQ